MNITNNESNPNPKTIPEVDDKVEHEPFVLEEDFPQKGSRLEELIATYRKEKNVPVVVPKDDLLANVKTKPGLKVKTFDDLKPEEQAKVMARIEEVDYTLSSDILNFGSAKESAMTKHAEEIVSKYAAHEFDSISEPMTELVSILKSNNPSDILKHIGDKREDEGEKKISLAKSIREYLNIKKVKRKVHKALAKRKSIHQNLQELEIMMEKKKLAIQEDIKSYEDMGKATFVQVNEFGLDCVALNLMMDDAQTKLNRMIGGNVPNEKGEMLTPELDQEELYRAQNLQYAIERMRRREYSITSVRTSTVQIIPMLATLIKGDEIICEKISEVIELIIPLWYWQYAIAIGAIKQQEALRLQKVIRAITSKLITGNAKMLHDNMIAAQEELNTAAVAIEDLVIVQNYIEDMVITVQAKSKEATAKMLEGMKTMQEIEDRNQELLTQPMLEDVTKKMMSESDE